MAQQNKGFEPNRARKFTRTFGKSFVTQFLCGTFSVPNREYFSEPETSRKILEIRQKEAPFASCQAPKSENSEPEKMQFHTASQSIPPARLPPIFRIVQSLRVWGAQGLRWAKTRVLKKDTRVSKRAF